MQHEQGATEEAVCWLVVHCKQSVCVKRVAPLVLGQGVDSVLVLEEAPAPSQSASMRCVASAAVRGPLSLALSRSLSLSIDRRRHSRMEAMATTFIVVTEPGATASLKQH
ncbi:hypothetical protein Ciccas_006140 [Cichlidogyrus casuarinus]|uniref:Uncharacterized protein n=1 Tax=Cichlidogyrus casuarinus TaxID=1844966 RepID=A0ABD2Q6M6_9PLAT